MKNRAIILAAGRGSRMGNETASKPKCFTVLDGKRLLDWQIESLNDAGIDNITVVRGYKSEMFEGDFNKVDNKRWSETNMVASLFCAQAFAGNTIISYSDIVYKKEHVINLNKSKADITITADKEWADLWKLRFENPLDDAETFKSDGEKLIEIGGKTQDISEIEAQYMGLIKLSEKGWEVMFELFESLSDIQKDKMDMTSMLNLLLSKGVKINIVFVEGGWCEADEYSDILAYEKEMKNNLHWKHDWR
jgi:L-glutamine-phosphate cytidylyltransferase